jgi:hypothetical protein
LALRHLLGQVCVEGLDQRPFYGPQLDLFARAAAGDGVVDRVWATYPDADEVVRALECAGAAVETPVTVALDELLGGEVLDDRGVAVSTAAADAVPFAS